MTTGIHNDPQYQAQTVLRLRVELYAAAQIMKGEARSELKTLIRELYLVLDIDHDTAAEHGRAKFTALVESETKAVHDAMDAKEAELDAHGYGGKAKDAVPEKALDLEQLKAKLIAAALRALDSSEAWDKACNLTHTFVMLERESKS